MCPDLLTHCLHRVSGSRNHNKRSRRKPTNPGAGFRDEPGAGAEQLSADCEGHTAGSGLFDRPCVASSRAPAHLLQPNKERFPSPRSSAVRARTSTQHRGRKRRLGGGHRAAEKHTGTQSSHLKSTDRAAVPGGEQGRLECDTVRLALRLRKLSRDERDKQKRSATRGPTWSLLRGSASSRRRAAQLFGTWTEFAAAPENGFFQHRQRTAHFGSRDFILSPCSRGEEGVQTQSPQAPRTLSTVFVPHTPSPALLVLIFHLVINLCQSAAARPARPRPAALTEFLWMTEGERPYRPRVPGPETHGWPTSSGRCY